MNKRLALLQKCTVIWTVPFLVSCLHDWDRNIEANLAHGRNDSDVLATEPTAPTPVEPAHHYIPVPIPGQLMAMPSIKQLEKQPDSTVVSGQIAVKKANKDALQTPQSDQYFNAIQVYPYMPGAVYTIYASTGKITDIQLEHGEKVINIATSDSTNWQIQTSPSGSEAKQVMHILIKPMTSLPAENTLVVLTNRRTYHLLLKPTSNHSFMIGVQWKYPDSNGSIFLSKNSQLKKQNFSFIDDVINPATITFDYKWNALFDKRPDWYPEHIFHDMKKTYIRFPNTFNQQTDLPILYALDGNGGYSTMHNWRLINNNTMVIDAVLKRAKLETGSVKGKRTTVQIRMISDETR